MGGFPIPKRTSCYHPLCSKVPRNTTLRVPKGGQKTPRGRANDLQDVPYNVPHKPQGQTHRASELATLRLSLFVFLAPFIFPCLRLCFGVFWCVLVCFVCFGVFRVFRVFRARAFGMRRACVRREQLRAWHHAKRLLVPKGARTRVMAVFTHARAKHPPSGDY